MTMGEAEHRRLRRIGLAVAALSFLADQGHKFAMLYGFGFRDWRFVYGHAVS